ncbi:MAG: arginine--tRNA ligase, partial [Bacteroidales bacterium]|nr:arginine--tRNA ligase [Bacteroidales bacterium]
MIHNTIAQKVVEAINKIYGKELDIARVQLQKTVRDFKGDFTVVVFPLLKISGKSPSDTGNDLGIYLKNELDAVEDFNVVKGF